MAFESLSDEFIEGLISCRKHVENPKMREQVKPGHKQFNYKVQALDESGHQFMLYTRQNTEEGMDDDFSCGLLWLASNGECLTLCRYNGSAHIHRNKLENTSLELTCHIHRATEKYIVANQKPEGFAYPTEEYRTLNEALHCLIKECCIEGLMSGSTRANQIDLFT